jgi:hypothetical protein
MIQPLQELYMSFRNHEFQTSNFKSHITSNFKSSHLIIDSARVSGTSGAKALDFHTLNVAAEAATHKALL